MIKTSGHSTLSYYISIMDLDTLPLYYYIDVTASRGEPDDNALHYTQWIMMDLFINIMQDCTQRPRVL